MIRRIVVLACAGMATAGTCASTAAAAETTTCNPVGQVTWTPGLTTTERPQTLTLHASMFCYTASASGNDVTGNIAVGEPVTINGASYFAPDPVSGTASCLNGTTTGRGIIKWTDGRRTIVSLDGHGGALSVYTMTVIDKIRLQRVAPNENGTPHFDDITTTRFPVSTTGVFALTSSLAGGILSPNPPGLASCNGGGITGEVPINLSVLTFAAAP